MSVSGRSSLVSGIGTSARRATCPPAGMIGQPSAVLVATLGGIASLAVASLVVAAMPARLIAAPRPADQPARPAVPPGVFDIVPGPDGGASRQLFPHRPELAVDLKNFDSAVESRDWPRAAGIVAALLREDGDANCPVGEGRYVPTRAILEARVRRCPGELLATYRAFAEPQAELLWRELRNGNDAVLSRLTGEYRLTKFGSPALEYAAEIMLDRGQFARAARLLRRRLEDPAGTTVERGLLLLKLAVCLERSDVVDEARTVPARLKTEAPELTVSIAGRRVSAEGWLERRLGQAAVARGVPGGLPADPKPALLPRWSTRLRPDPVQAGPRDAAEEFRRSLFGGDDEQQGDVAAVVEARTGHLIVRNRSALHRIDIGSGEVLSKTTLPHSAVPDGKRDGYTPEELAALAGTVNHATGITPAGDRLFLLEHHVLPPPKALRDGDGNIIDEAPVPAPVNRLTARNAADGKVIWTIAGGMTRGAAKPAVVEAPRPADAAEPGAPRPGQPAPAPAPAPAPVPAVAAPVGGVGEDPADARRLPDDARFDAEPTEGGGRLYVTLTAKGKWMAACLRAADGEVLWLRPVAHCPPGALLSETESPWIGSGSVAGPPAVAGGTVYVLSRFGAAAALDAVDGETVWLAEIPGAGIPVEEPNGDDERVRLDFRSRPPLQTPLLLEGVLYAIDHEADRLMALAAVDGRTAKAHGARLNGCRWMLGRSGAHLVCAGPGLAVVDLGTGKVAGARSGDKPAGRPLLAQGVVYVPAVVHGKHALHRWDIRNPARPARTTLPPDASTGRTFRLGMLLTAGDRLLSVSASQVHMFADLEMEIRRLRDLPSAPDRQLRLGRLLQHADRETEARRELDLAIAGAETAGDATLARTCRDELFDLLIRQVDRLPAGRETEALRLLREAEPAAEGDPARWAALQFQFATAEVLLDTPELRRRAAVRLLTVMEAPDVQCDTADADVRRGRGRLDPVVTTSSHDFADTLLWAMAVRHGPSLFELPDAIGSSAMAAFDEVGAGPAEHRALHRRHRAGTMGAEMLLAAARSLVTDADARLARQDRLKAEEHLAAANDLLKACLEMPLATDAHRATATAGLAEIAVHAPWRYVPAARSWQRKLAALPDDMPVSWPGVTPRRRDEVSADLRARLAKVIADIRKDDE